MPNRRTCFGLRLASSYIIAAAKVREPFTDGDTITRRVESVLSSRFDAREVLVTTKDGLLLCVAPGSATDAPVEFGRQLESLVSADQDWQIGIGRPYAGPGGILHSYQEARATLELAASLALDTRVLNATDLLVFQVLFRDCAVITDLVDTVLTPLNNTRAAHSHCWTPSPRTSPPTKSPPSRPGNCSSASAHSPTASTASSNSPATTPATPLNGSPWKQPCLAPAC